MITPPSAATAWGLIAAMPSSTVTLDSLYCGSTSAATVNVCPVFSQVDAAVTQAGTASWAQIAVCRMP
jgi:hypothetical protein